MVRSLNNKEIEAKVLEIVDYIKESEDYKKYLKARELIESDQRLMEIISLVKKYQKEIVKNPFKKKELEEKIADCLEILNSDPTYLEYLTLQEEINNLLIIFENKINKYFESVFN